MKLKKQQNKKLDACLKTCQAGLDGECFHKLCPQIRDGEPEKSDRFCPLPAGGWQALRESDY